MKLKKPKNNSKFNHEKAGCFKTLIHFNFSINSWSQSEQEKEDVNYLIRSESGHIIIDPTFKG